MHLKEMGWSAKFEPLPTPHMTGSADGEQTKFKFNNAMSWHGFWETIEQERSDQLWQQASEHRGGQGIEEGVDLTVPNKQYNSLVKDR